MNNGSLSGGVDLSKSGQVALNTSIIVPLGAIDFLEGGISHYKGGYNIRVVDVQKGAAWYIPCDVPFLRKLMSQLGELLVNASPSDYERG